MLRTSMMRAEGLVELSASTAKYCALSMLRLSQNSLYHAGSMLHVAAACLTFPCACVVPAQQDVMMEIAFGAGLLVSRAMHMHSKGAPLGPEALGCMLDSDISTVVAVRHCCYTYLPIS